jgi:DNA-directed RNA polymerase
MDPVTSSRTEFTTDWKDLYIAALFENDKTRLAQRIAAAQVAIAARRQEVLVTGNDPEERRVLDNAGFSLQALAQCFAIGQLVANRGLEQRSAR